MNEADLQHRLDFLRNAERLKDTLRSGFTTQGQQESVAEHTWRLCLLVITFSDQLAHVDLLKLLKICILHDLGEAIDGDIPAPNQVGQAAKSEKERNDFRSLLTSLPEFLRAEFLSLWDEYELARSPEAVAAKALDKVETLLQHNQGTNPPDFDYRFNIDYARAHTDRLPLAKQIRTFLDAETSAHAARMGQI
ncbi:HD domain-containing protein [Lacunimicrobium album]